MCPAELGPLLLADGTQQLAVLIKHPGPSAATEEPAEVTETDSAAEEKRQQGLAGLT